MVKNGVNGIKWWERNCVPKKKSANSVLSFMLIYLPRHILSPLKTHKASRVVCPGLLGLEQWPRWERCFIFLVSWLWPRRSWRIGWWLMAEIMGDYVWPAVQGPALSFVSVITGYKWCLQISSPSRPLRWPVHFHISWAKDPHQSRS